jgi:hypothetical protein
MYSIWYSFSITLAIEKRNLMGKESSFIFVNSTVKYPAFCSYFHLLKLKSFPVISNFPLFYSDKDK